MRLGTFLMVQWLRICLPMQGTQVQSLVQEDPTFLGATKPEHHIYQSGTLEPKHHNEGVALAHCNERKLAHSRENPVQPKKK